MKKTLIALLSCSALLGSCTKSTDNKCEPVTIAAPDAEVTALQTYLSSKGISAQKDDRGFFYTISKQGSDLHPSICSTVKANYTLWLTNGTEVETGKGATFSLGGVILGWQEGVPLIGEGGTITLYLPPSLAYGSQASGNIPANSMLVFEVYLMDVQ